MVIAVTGSLGTGKSSVVKLLQQKHVLVFDCDRQIHSYYNNSNSLVFKKVVKLFPGVICSGVISRPALAQVVFADPKLLKKLETITHPQVVKDLKQWIKQVNKEKKIGIAEVPLLFEKRLQGLFDLTILVTAPVKKVYSRIKNRTGMSRPLANKRLSFYLPVKDKIKQADIVIKNDSSQKSLKKSVDIVWDLIKRI